MMNNKKGFALILSMGVVFLVIALILIFWTIFSTKAALIIGGIGLIALTIIFGFRGTMNRTKGGMMFLFILIGAILILIPSFGLIQTQYGKYIQVPDICYYKCEEWAEVESAWVAVPEEGTGFIGCPSNTDGCDILMRAPDTSSIIFGEQIVYQICGIGDCRDQVFFDTSQGLLKGDNKRYTDRISLAKGEAIWIDYLSCPTGAIGFLISLGQCSAVEGAEYKLYYEPLILTINGPNIGSRPYLGTTQNGLPTEAAIERGCKFKTLERGDLIDNILNSKESYSQSSTSDYSLIKGQTRNFICGFDTKPSFTADFVNVNGVDGYCINRQVFAISTIKTNEYTYKVVDTDFNKKLRDFVDCCPSEKEPTRVCTAGFTWTPILEAECSITKPCEDIGWNPDPNNNKQLRRFICINNKCVADFKPVECTIDEQCPEGKTCDPLTFTCVDVPGPEDVILTCGDGICQPKENFANCPSDCNVSICSWWEQSYVKKTKDYGFMYWRAFTGNPIIHEEPGCRIASWVIGVIIGGIVIVLGVFAMLIFKTRKKRGKR